MMNGLLCFYQILTVSGTKTLPDGRKRLILRCIVPLELETFVFCTFVTVIDGRKKVLFLLGEGFHLNFVALDVIFIVV